MSASDTLLTTLGFPDKYPVRYRTSIADLIPERARCGIYVLHLSDETYYVGLSKDVTERYRQHRLRFPDIEFLSFKRLRYESALLRAEEKQTIYYLNAHHIPLLNHVHNTISYGSSLFDLVMEPHEQRRWLAFGTQGVDTHVDERPVIKSEKIHRDQRKIAAFQQLSNHNQIADALNTYITQTVPVYFRTEGRFWSMSCLPSTFGGWRAAAISMSYMETFVIFRDATCFVNIASRVFDQHYSADSTFLETHPDTELTTTGYEAAGFDQVNIRAHTYTATYAVLTNRVVQEGARLMNLSLMRQRATLFSGSHSPLLASFVLKTDAA